MPACPMFTCQHCGHQEFELMTQPGMDADVSIRVNEANDVEIHVNGQRFVADLAFMNRFATCANCHAKHCWDYHYP